MKALIYNKLGQDFEIDETLIHIVNISVILKHNRYSQW